MKNDEKGDLLRKQGEINRKSYKKSEKREK